MVERIAKLKRKPAEGARVLDPAKQYGAKAIHGDAARGNSHRRGYNRRWSKARATILMREPLCRVAATLEGIDEAATVVDHFFPHCDLQWLFWTKQLWVPMSKRAHDGWKARLEAQGEAVLDEMALKLGLPTLATLEPRRVAEWRVAFANRRHSKW